MSKLRRNGGVGIADVHEEDDIDDDADDDDSIRADDTYCVLPNPNLVAPSQFDCGFSYPKSILFVFVYIAWLRFSIL